MVKLAFTVSARTARLIGRENVSNAEGAVIELVKNSYDADADFGLIYVVPAKKTIYILDNGCGMSEKEIKENWMNIGTDNKENDFKSQKGRIKSGAKGIGRFALDRLGSKCTMITLKDGKKDGFRWITNWNDFEKANTTIGNVYATLEPLNNLNLVDVLKKELDNQKVIKEILKHSMKKGTILKIEYTRDKWDSLLSDKIFHSLEILTPPDGQQKFDIYFYHEGLNSQFGKITNEVFTDYDYKIVATYKKNKDKELKIEFHRNEFDYNLIESNFFERPDMQEFPYDRRTFKKQKYSIDTDFYDLMKGLREKEKNQLTESIGDFTFILYFFKLGSSVKFDTVFKYKSFNSSIRRKWAEKFSGIKLFRDNFRVRPYGEIGTASYDWLMLGERQSKNPAGVSREDFQIKPYQVAGTINFSRTSKLFLEDKSDREGLIENETFSLFKNLLEGIISKLEEDRSKIASNLKAYADENSEDIQDGLEALKIAEEDDEPENIQEVRARNLKLKKGVRSQKKLLEQKEDELVLSRSMASAGILIASFSHEFHHIKHKLNNRASNLKGALESLLPASKVKNIENRKNPYYLITQLKELDDKIKQWIDFSIMLTRKDRRKSQKISLHQYFSEYKRSWQKKLNDRGCGMNVSFSSDKPNEYLVKMIELDLDTIFDNLIANTLEAFQRNGFKGDRIIRINLSSSPDEISIDYSDTGPGLSKDIKKPEDIFKPFVTTKRDKLGNEIGTGLGMWLVKSSVDDNHGTTKLYSPEKGFKIKINLHRVK